MTQITTLIPAYKKEYLAELFVGLRQQSFKDFQIILSDDSPDGVITNMIRQGHFASLTSNLNMVVVRGPRNAMKNHQQLLDMWGGKTPLLHFHMDDDVIYPDFYRTHVEIHATGAYCASVSSRWLSGDDGRPAWRLPLPDFITHSDKHLVHVTTEQLFASTIPMCQNWAGELSNMVISAQGACDYPCLPTEDVSYYGLPDIGFLLNASRHLPVAYVRDHLSVFRQHGQQTTHNVASLATMAAFLAWIAYALAAWREGRITQGQAVQAIDITSKRCLQHFDGDERMEAFYSILEHHASTLEMFHERFRVFWLELIARC